MKNNSYLCNDKPKTNDFPMPRKKNNYWWTKLQRTLDHEMSLSYWRLLGWLTLVFLAVLLLVVLLLGAIALLYPKFNLGDINIFEAAFLLLTDPGNLGSVFPQNQSWVVGIVYGLIATLGAVLFSGALISILSNSIQRRVDNFLSGNVRYDLHHHLVVIGYDALVPPLVSQLSEAWPEKDILLLTRKKAEEVREELNTRIGADNKHIILYSGRRDSDSDLQYLQAGQADEIFIIGDRESADHDALNIACLSKLTDIVSRHPSSASHRPTVNVLLENHATKVMLQSTNLAQKWQQHLDVIPFSFYENWARQVLTDSRYPRILVSPDSSQQVNLIIFGMSQLGITLAVETAHSLHFAPLPDGRTRKTTITFISLHAREEMMLFRTRYRQIFEIQSSRYLDLTTSKPSQAENIPPTYFTGKDADFLDIDFEFVQGDAFSEQVYGFLSERASTRQRHIAAFVCTGHDTIDMDIALHLPESILRGADTFVRQHHSGLLLQWLSEINKQESGKYARIYPFGMADTQFDLHHTGQRMGILINYYYWFRHSHPERFDESHLLTAEEQAEALHVWNSMESTANQWSSFYCCHSFAQKMAQWGVDTLEPDTLPAIKDVMQRHLGTMAFIEHSRWNMEKLLMGFRKPRREEQAEIDQCRKTTADTSKESAVSRYKRQRIHDYIRPFSDLANITWPGMDRAKEDIRKIDYDMLHQLPWIIRNIAAYGSTSTTSDSPQGM